MSLLEYEPPVRRPWWKVRLGILLPVLGLWVLAIWYLASHEASMIFQAPAAASNGQSPADSGIAFEDLHIPVDPNSFIEAWWIPANEHNEKVLLYFHGNAEVLQDESAELELFRQTGYNLLFVDYRGYGHSSKLQTTETTTRADARAALRYLEQERHFSASRIVICGWSVGTAVAAQLAFESPDVGGLILVSPITSVPDVANEDWSFRYLFRPAQWLRHDNDMATKDKIAFIHIPTLIMVGTDDTLARPWMARELYARAPGPKTLQLISGANHISIMDNESGMVFRSIQTFLQSVPTSAAHTN